MAASIWFSQHGMGVQCTSSWLQSKHFQHINRSHSHDCCKCTLTLSHSRLILGRRNKLMTRPANVVVQVSGFAQHVANASVCIVFYANVSASRMFVVNRPMAPQETVEGGHQNWRRICMSEAGGVCMNGE